MNHFRITCMTCNGRKINLVTMADKAFLQCESCSVMEEMVGKMEKVVGKEGD